MGTAVATFSASAFVTHATVILTAATGWQCAPSSCFAFAPLTNWPFISLCSLQLKTPHLCLSLS